MRAVPVERGLLLSARSQAVNAVQATLQLTKRVEVVPYCQLSERGVTPTRRSLKELLSLQLTPVVHSNVRMTPQATKSVPRLHAPTSRLRIKLSKSDSISTSSSDPAMGAVSVERSLPSSA